MRVSTQAVNTRQRYLVPKTRKISLPFWATCFSAVEVGVLTNKNNSGNIITTIISLMT